jgi:ketosteroid isomerase-like protein
MSQENVELIRFGYDALNRRDYEAWISTLHPEVELHELPTSPDATVFKGRDQVREWTRSVFEVGGGEGSRFDPESFEEIGRFVLVRVRAVLFARGSAVPVEGRLFHVIEVADGEARRIWGFLTEDDAREHIRLSEQDAHADS